MTADEVSIEDEALRGVAAEHTRKPGFASSTGPLRASCASCDADRVH